VKARVVLGSLRVTRQTLTRRVKGEGYKMRYRQVHLGSLFYSRCRYFFRNSLQFHGNYYIGSSLVGIELMACRTEVHFIKAGHPLYRYCSDTCLKNKNLYNYANYLIRQQFFYLGYGS
jgi:hypothetical protein